MSSQCMLDSRIREAKEFRDCIHHYFSPGVHTDFADVQKLGLGFWTLTAWLPDNVETRSALHFRYAKEADALTFGWSLANRTIELFEKLASTIAPARDAGGAWVGDTAG